MEITFYGGYYRKLEKEGSRITIPGGTTEWVLLHFYSPMVVTLNRRKMETQANACILFRPGTAQDYYGRFGAFENDYIRFLPKDGHFFKEYNLPVNEIFYVASEDVIKEEMQNITFFLTEKGANHDYELTENTVAVLKKLQDARVWSDEKTQRLSETQFRLNRLRQQVRENPEKWTVDLMAENFYITRSHFSVLYKKNFGTSPVQDIKAFVNEKAVRLLTQSQKTVQQIAVECGYNECENFIRAFKKMNGTSPLKFRKIAHGG